MYAIIAHLETNCCKPRFVLVQLGLQEGLSMGNCVSVLIVVICLSLKKSQSVRGSLSKGLNRLFQGKVKLKFNEFSTPEII